MKRVLLFFLLCIVLMLSGCDSKVPEHMKNPKTEFLQVEDYQRTEYSIPSNYRLIKNGVYAVLDDNDNVTGFMKLIEENGEYRWEESNSDEAYK